MSHLQQVTAQFAAWHGAAVDGREDDDGDGATGTLEAAVQRDASAGLLEQAERAIAGAASSPVRSGGSGHVERGQWVRRHELLRG